MIETQTFKRDNSGWRSPLILSIIISLIAVFTDRSLFYIHYYLFFAAIIGYYISTIDLLSLNSDGLEINLGILSSRKNFFVEWATIKQIEIIQDPRKWRTKTYGITGRGGGGYRPLEELCLQIQFINSLPYSIQKLIKKYGDSFFNRIFVRDEGKTIIILNSFYCSYETIYNYLNLYHKKRKLNTIVPKKNNIKILDVFLLGMPVFICAFKIFR